MRNVVSAYSKCASDVTAIARTRLRGVASMVVEVVDTQDPIKVGQHETYEIHVTNQGSAEETNVMVACELPGQMALLSTQGATESNSRAGARKVIFRPVPHLAAGDTAKWQVKVRGREPGDLRFSVTVDSDQHGRPVRETEATRVFN